MDIKYLAKTITYLSFSILVAVFISGPMGLWLVNKMDKKGILFTTIKNWQLTNQLWIYKLIGLSVFAWFVNETFFKHFNTKIKINRRPNRDDINQLKTEMTIAEICHLIGFVFVLPIQLIGFLLYGFNSLFYFLLILNVIFNLYPVLLQEHNKTRLTKFEMRLKT
jgi:hypothetical protein